MTIYFFLMAFQCFVSEYIHDYVIKHQITWHDTSRIIVTYVIFLQNWLTIQYDIFDEGKISFPNGRNINFYFRLLDWQQTWTLEKCSLMGKQCDSNPYPYPNGFSVCTNFLIHLEYWREQSLSYFEQNCEPYKYVVWEIKISLWLNYLNYDVNVIPYMDWPGFNHRSGGICDSCGYLLYDIFLYWEIRWYFVPWGKLVIIFLGFCFAWWKLIVLFL